MTTVRPGQDPQPPDQDIKPTVKKMPIGAASATIEIITIDQEVVQVQMPTSTPPEPPTQMLDNGSGNLGENMTSPPIAVADFQMDSHLEKTFEGVLTDLAIFEDTLPEINYNDWLAEQTRISKSTLAEASNQVKDPKAFQTLQSDLFEALKNSESVRHAVIDYKKMLAELVRSQVQVQISSQTWSEQVSFDWVSKCRSQAEVLALMQDGAVTKVLLKYFSRLDVMCRDLYNEAKMKQAEMIFAVIEAVQGYQSSMADKLERLGPCSDEILETWHSECLEAATRARKEALDRDLERVWETLVHEARTQFQITNETARSAEAEQRKVRLAEAEIKRSKLPEHAKTAMAEIQGLATKFHELMCQKPSGVIMYSGTELIKIHDQVKNKVLGYFNTEYDHVMELDYEATGATLDAEFEEVKAAEAKKRDDLHSSKSASAKASKSSQDLTKRPSADTEKKDQCRRAPADTEKNDRNRRHSADTEKKDQSRRPPADTEKNDRNRRPSVDTEKKDQSRMSQADTEKRDQNRKRPADAENKDHSRRTSSDTKIRDQNRTHSTEASKHNTSSSSKTSRRTSESDRKRKSRSRSPARKLDRHSSTRTSSTRQRDDQTRTRDRSRTPTRRKRSRSRSREKSKDDRSQRSRTTSSSTSLENTNPKSGDTNSSSTSKKAEASKSSATTQKTLESKKIDPEPPLKSKQAAPTTSEPLYDRRPLPAASLANKRPAVAVEEPPNPPKLPLSQHSVDVKPTVKIEPGTSEATDADLKPAPQHQVSDNHSEAQPAEPILPSKCPVSSSMLQQLKQAQLQARAKAAESVSQTNSSETANRKSKSTLSATQQAIIDKCTGRSSSTAPLKSEQSKSAHAVGGNTDAKTVRVPSSSNQNPSKRLSTESPAAADNEGVPTKRVCALAVCSKTAVPVEHQLSNENAEIQASQANLLPPPVAQQSSSSSSALVATSSGLPQPPFTVTDPKPASVLPAAAPGSTASPSSLVPKSDTAPSTASLPVTSPKAAPTTPPPHPVNSISILMGENKFYVESYIEGIKIPVFPHDPIFHIALDPGTSKIIVPRPGSPKEAINVIEGLMSSETLEYRFYQNSKVKIFVDKLVGLYFALEVVRKHAIKAEHLPTIHVRVAVPAVLPSGGRHQLKNGLKIAGFTKVSLEESTTLVQIPTAIAIGQSENLTEGGTKEAVIIVTHLQSTSVESALLRITPSGVVETKTTKALDTTNFNGANVFSLVSAANLAKRAKIDPQAITRKFLFVDPAAVGVYENDPSNNKRHKMEWARLHNPGVVLAGLRRITEVCAGAKSPKELYQEKFPYSVCIDPQNQNNRWIVKRDDDITEIPKKLRHTIKPMESFRIMTYFGEQERTKLEVVQASAAWNYLVKDQSPGILPSVEVSLDSEGLIRLWIDKEDRRFIKTRVHYMFGDCMPAAAEIKQILATEPQVPQLANPGSANTSPSGS